ncbi:MAG: hypothetical protein ACFFC3_15340 [Candidatus Odinarchaeota archaeon]
MAKKKTSKKTTSSKEEDFELPDGKVDEEGDEILDLDDWKDNLEDDVIYEIPEDDEMIAEETEDEEFGMEIDEVVKMLREVKCKPCPGLKSKPDCKVAHDHGCPKPNKP